jgi:hypothetical protein
VPFRFDPPGWAPDFDAPGRERWHEQMARSARSNVAQIVEQLQAQDPTASAADAFYVDPTETDIPANASTVAVTWAGFPKRLLTLAGGDRDLAHQHAEDLGTFDYAQGAEFVTASGQSIDMPSRQFQDEYLEWRTDRVDGVPSRVTFTCEAYDYWEELFAHDEKLVVDRYRELLGRDDVTADDLRVPEDVFLAAGGGPPGQLAFRAGTYNPRNRFNTSEGIVHLTHRANSLGAEVNLAAISSALRKDAAGRDVTGEDANRLTCCGAFGDPNRNSDPTIGAAANNVARSGKAYTLTNPVGLYIADFDHEAVTLPDGSSAPREWWRVERGRAQTDDGFERIMRLVFEVPADVRGAGGEPLRAGDLMVRGAPLERGAQLAELVTLHLMVSAWDAPERRAIRAACETTCCVGGPDQQVLFISDSACAAGTGAFDDLLPDGRGAAVRAGGAQLATVVAPDGSAAQPVLVNLELDRFLAGGSR